MDPQLAARIIYTRENNRLLHMYYEQLTGLSLEDDYLPPLKDDDMDIGQRPLVDLLSALN